MNIPYNQLQTLQEDNEKLKGTIFSKKNEIIYMKLKLILKKLLKHLIGQSRFKLKRIRNYEKIWDRLKMSLIGRPYAKFAKEAIQVFFELKSIFDDKLKIIHQSP